MQPSGQKDRPRVTEGVEVGFFVEMISQGASNVNLSCVVSEAQAQRAVRLLHRGLGLDAIEAPVQTVKQ